MLIFLICISLQSKEALSLYCIIQGLRGLLGQGKAFNLFEKSILFAIRCYQEYCKHSQRIKRIFLNL